jgi:apolipoprotein N-acyltransferase
MQVHKPINCNCRLMMIYPHVQLKESTDLLRILKNHGSRIVLAGAGGVLLTLAFPRAGLGWLAWVALVPLVLAIRQVRPGAGFFLGFSFGMVHNLSLVYWVVFTMHQYGNIPVYQAVVLLVMLAAYLSLFPAAFAAALTWMRPGPSRLILLAPVLWMGLELIRNRLLTGFPWELLGYSQFEHLRLIQMADIFGVYGLSGLIVLCNCVLAVGILGWLELPWQEWIPGRKTVVRSATALIVVLAAAVIYGQLRINSIDRAAAASEQIRVAVVQGNIDQAQKWDPRFQVLTTVKYRRLSLESPAKDADLIIWPETATPFYFMDNPVLTDMVLEGIKATSAHFIIGSPSYAKTKGHLIYHNSAYLVSPQGKSQGKYDKVHLVPFGEYVPMKRFLPFIDKLVAQVGDFKPGRKGHILAWAGHRVGVLICYESIFPELARATVRNGADLLVNITNDAWFGRTGAAFQHFSMAVFRAVENRRCLARAANTGISGFIDANGRIIHTTDLFEDAVVTRPTALLKVRSLYTRWGDWPLWVLTLGLTALCIRRRIKRENWT